MPSAPHSSNRLPALPSAELKAVDFGNNSMGKEGAAALADLLRGSKTITDVNINMNDVGNDGAFQVRSADLFAGAGAAPCCCCSCCSCCSCFCCCMLLSSFQQPACATRLCLPTLAVFFVPNRLRPPSPAPRRSRCVLCTPALLELVINVPRSLFLLPLHRLRPPSPAPRRSSCWMWAATTSARTAPRPWHVSWLVWAGRAAVGVRASKSSGAGEEAARLRERGLGKGPGV